MKKLFAFLFLLVWVGSNSWAQQSYKPKSLKPTNYIKRVTTLNSGKSRSYYSLDDKEVAVIALRGPGKLRLISRVRFISNEDESISYEVIYSLNGGELKTEKFKNVEPSTAATYQNKALGIPGQLRDFEIELDRGNHSLEFKLPENSKPVAMRYVFTPVKEKKQEWISYCAMRPSEPVDIISREVTVSYYRFSNEKALKVEVNGPTQLRVLTRTENHYQMKGRIQYRVQVKENNEIINTYMLSSRRSEIAVYKDDQDLIPGKACEFVINVPKGRHVYEIIPLDKDKNAVLGRFLLPLKDVSLVN